MAESISKDESLRQLRDFVRQLESLLAELTEHPGTLIPGRHHEAMRAAWNSVRPKFSILIKQLQTRERRSISQLEKQGLIGDELVFKLSIFNHAHDQLRDEVARKEASQEGWLRGRWRALARLWKGTLAAGDVILGSLARALPLSPAEAIKEYKEAAESGLELGLGFSDVVESKEESGSKD